MTPDSARDGQAEVSYLFLPEHWGNGYAREAVSAVISWALQAISPPPPVVVAVTQEAKRSDHVERGIRPWPASAAGS